MKLRFLILPLFCFVSLISCNAKDNSATNNTDKTSDYTLNRYIILGKVDTEKKERLDWYIDTDNGNLIIMNYYGEDYTIYLSIPYDRYKLLYHYSQYSGYSVLYEYTNGYYLLEYYK